MISPAQAKRDRKTLHKAIAKDLRAKAKAKVLELKEAVRGARKARKELHLSATGRCKLARVEARERAQERRKRALAELNAANRQARELARFVCTSGKAAAKDKSGMVKARAALKAERDYQRELKRIERGNRKARPALAKAHRRSESDDEVQANLDPDMQALFWRVRGKIKGSDRMTRTEAFLKYAEENPREVLGALDDVAEERIRAFEQEHKAARKHARKRRYTAAELASVPF